MVVVCLSVEINKINVKWKYKTKPLSLLCFFVFIRCEQGTTTFM